MASGGYRHADYEIDDLEAPKPGRGQQYQEQGYGQGYSGGYQNSDGYNGYVPTATAMHEGDFDPSVPIAQAIETVEVELRHGFIRKTFSILFVQLLVTFGWCLLCSYHDSTKNYMQENTWPLALGIAVTFGSLIAMICGGVIRNYPSNYIMLSLFTCGQSLLLGMVVSQYDADAVSIAIGTTLAVVFVLVLFAMQTKYDFTGMGVYLMCGLWVMIIYGFIAGIMGTGGGLIYAWFGTLLFSAYIIYDVQLIVGGKHKTYQFSIDDYCLAALSIYLDIINLFLYILQLLNDR